MGNSCSPGSQSKRIFWQQTFMCMQHDVEWRWRERRKSRMRRSLGEVKSCMRRQGIVAGAVARPQNGSFPGTSFEVEERLYYWLDTSFVSTSDEDEYSEMTGRGTAAEHTASTMYWGPSPRCTLECYQIMKGAEDATNEFEKIDAAKTSAPNVGHEAESIYDYSDVEQDGKAVMDVSERLDNRSMPGSPALRKTSQEIQKTDPGVIATDVGPDVTSVIWTISSAQSSASEQQQHDIAKELSKKAVFHILIDAPDGSQRPDNGSRRSFGFQRKRIPEGLANGAVPDFSVFAVGESDYHQRNSSDNFHDVEMDSSSLPSEEPLIDIKVLEDQPSKKTTSSVGQGSRIKEAEGINFTEAGGNSFGSVADLPSVNTPYGFQLGKRLTSGHSNRTVHTDVSNEDHKPETVASSQDETEDASSEMRYFEILQKVNNSQGLAIKAGMGSSFEIQVPKDSNRFDSANNSYGSMADMSPNRVVPAINMSVLKHTGKRKSTEGLVNRTVPDSTVFSREFEGSHDSVFGANSCDTGPAKISRHHAILTFIRTKILGSHRKHDSEDVRKMMDERTESGEYDSSPAERRSSDARAENLPRKPVMRLMSSGRVTATEPAPYQVFGQAIQEMRNKNLVDSLANVPSSPGGVNFN